MALNMNPTTPLSAMRANCGFLATFPDDGMKFGILHNMIANEGKFDSESTTLYAHHGCNDC